jgi:hypothetical protein
MFCDLHSNPLAFSIAPKPATALAQSVFNLLGLSGSSSVYIALPVIYLQDMASCAQICRFLALRALCGQIID